MEENGNSNGTVGKERMGDLDHVEDEAMADFGHSNGTPGEVKLEGVGRAKATLLAGSRAPLTCEHCGRTFTIPQNLRRHKRTQHLGFRFPCQACPAEATRRRDLLQHYQRFHPERLDEAASIVPVRRPAEASQQQKQWRKQWRQRNSLLRRGTNATVVQPDTLSHLGDTKAKSIGILETAAGAAAGRPYRPIRSGKGLCPGRAPEDCGGPSLNASIARSARMLSSDRVALNCQEVVDSTLTLDHPDAVSVKPGQYVIAVDTPLNSREVLDSTAASAVHHSGDTLQQFEMAAGCSDGNGKPEPQRVVVALDPVTQFRLERVVAERASRITERSVIETLDEAGRVVKRETIEREYFLNDA